MYSTHTSFCVSPEYLAPGHLSDVCWGIHKEEEIAAALHHARVVLMVGQTSYQKMLRGKAMSSVLHAGGVLYRWRDTLLVAVPSVQTFYRPRPGYGDIRAKTEQFLRGVGYHVIPHLGF